MHGKKVILALATVALVGVGAGADDDGDEKIKLRLQGFNEVPAVSTRGRGEFRATINEDSIDYVLSYSRLNSGAFMAHIHLGQKSVNGGISAWLCGGFGKPACPAGTGDEPESVSGTVVAADVIGPAGQGIAPGEFAELLRAIRKGVTYVNVHSATQPGGEIRAQMGGEGDDHRR